MNRLNVRVSAVAEADLDAVTFYISADNPDAARAFREEVIATLHRLSILPESGHLQRFTVEPRYSDIHLIRVSARFRNYMVFYRFDDDELTVVRVLHGARDIPRLLLEDSSRDPS